MYQKQSVSKSGLKSPCRIARQRRHKKTFHELWRLLERLVAHHSLTEIFETLQPESNVLKKHSQCHDRSKAVFNNNPQFPEFIELKPYPLKIPNHECIIEMENKNGSKMKINLNSIGLINIDNLTRSFWRDIK